MNRNIRLTLALAIALACPAWSQTPASSDFAPLEQWKNAVIAGDPAALKALYSSDPAAEIEADDIKTDAEGDVKFRTALKARSVKLEIVRETDQPSRHTPPCARAQAALRHEEGNLSRQCRRSCRAARSGRKSYGWTQTPAAGL